MKAVLGIITAAAVALAVAASIYAYTVGHEFATFKGSVCAIAGRQQAQGKHFVKLLATLESRAVARERLDKAAGRATQAAADSDSARLYASVLPRRGAPAPPHLDC